MKNALIAVLALLSAFLAYREFVRKEPQPLPAGLAGPIVRSPTTQTAPAAGFSAVGTPTAVEATVAEQPPPPGVVPPVLAAETRYILLQDVAWRYSKFIASRHLSSEKAKLLMDLLVDQRMAGLEAGIQTGTGNVTQIADKAKVAEASALDQKMLEELLGANGVAELEASGAEQSASGAADAGLSAIEATGSMPNDVRERAAAILKGYDSTNGMGDLIAAQTEITPDLERRLRAEAQANLDQVTGDLAGVLTPEQVAAYRSWALAKLDKDIAFTKMIWNANHKRG